MGKPQPTNPCFATGDGIICAGLPRSGTASLAAALKILGLGPVHHALHITDLREHYGWGQAAWCNFPYLRKTRMQWATDKLPFYINPADALLPWGRAEWDRLIGHQRVTTDFGSMFSTQLIKAYPEAQVILVERPEDSWAKSFRDALLNDICFGFPSFVLCTIGPWVDYPRPRIVRDIILGWLGVESRDEAWKKLPQIHREHSETVKQLVPCEQLLVYRYEDGWEPLCSFLGVEVPEEPFPRINDRDSISKIISLVQWKILSRVTTKLAFWSFGLSIFGFMMHKWLHQ